MTYRDNSIHPPPTLTIAVFDRKIRMKYNRGSSSPIQYFPEMFEASSAGVIATPNYHSSVSPFVLDVRRNSLLVF